MGKPIFVSFGLEHKATAYPEIDRIITKDSLRAIAMQAQHYNCTIIMRDHPATTAMMQFIFEEKPHNLVIVPETMTAAAIVQTYNPAAAFLIAGTGDVAADFKSLQSCPGLLVLPLGRTGGAAEKIEAELTQSGTLPELARKHGQDSFGFRLIAEALRLLGDAPQRPRPPAPKP